jgi:hypothetical protein
MKAIDMDTRNYITDMTPDMICPCGGGQSCIVDRRFVGDFVIEDDILKSAGLQVRKNCEELFDREQRKAIDTYMLANFSLH